MTITTTTAAIGRGAAMAGPSRNRPLRQPHAAVRGEAVAATAPEPAALYRLMAWLSPSYPIGAFSYSSGIEWAVETGDIADADTLRDWLAVMLAHGTGFCDGVLLAHAWRAAAGEAELRGVAELAAALAPTRERHLETTGQGAAFLDATRASWPCAALDRLAACGCAVAYPVAVGVAAAGHDVPLEQALAAYLQALLASWTSAGIRLIPLGQTAGQGILAALEGAVAATAQRALGASLDELGSCAFRADIASARHETQYTRLFRS
jgi:urease accessory protein